MPNHDIKQLDKNVAQISRGLIKLGEDKSLQELREKIFPRPGWTTPAEFQFALGISEAMLAHLKAIESLKQTLVAGSKAVGGN